MAAESRAFVPFFSLLRLTRMISRRRCRSPCPQATSCSNAGRISPAQQNSILAESTRECHQRPTYGTLLSVSYCFIFPATSIEWHLPGIQTCTKSGLSPQNETSHSWSIWTRRAQGSPRMLCTTTSSTERTRSRYIFILSRLSYSCVPQITFARK